MNLTLAIPSLNRRTDETVPPLNLPAFNQILRYSRLNRHPHKPSAFFSRHLWQGSLAAQAKQFLGLPKEQPAAFASPMWQQMGLHQAASIGGSHLAIQDHEAQQWCRGLTEFYQEDHWRFFPLRNDLWLVSMPSESDWQAAPAPDIFGHITPDDQAYGKDSLQWLNKQTEIQMWLHAHPLNRLRLDENRPAVNGLWLWQDLHGQQSGRRLLASDSPWAQFYPGTRIDAPYDFDAYMAAADEIGQAGSDGLIFLDDLALTEQTGDVWRYREILSEWEARWFEPLQKAVRSGRLNSLTIAADGENGGELILTPADKWRFWRPEKHFGGIW